MLGMAGKGGNVTFGTVGTTGIGGTASFGTVGTTGIGGNVGREGTVKVGMVGTASGASAPWMRLPRVYQGWGCGTRKKMRVEGAC
ncbi:hypothetical protein GW17_00047576 [Ensete ventricosum]|nr:hypothetical protein GW17_00047576 [Ensete ventricosum]